jgi:fatty acid desaturase
MVLTLTAMTCGLMFGEAVALLIGSYVISKKKLPWLTKKNLILLILDIVLAFLILIALPPLGYLPLIVFIAAVVLGIATHIFRTKEYFSEETNKFCDNQGLFIVNILKGLGLLVVLVVTIFF